MIVSINGVLTEAAAARIDPADRGFTLGDGVFETIVLRRNAFRHLAAHLDRLIQGASLLGIPTPGNAQYLADMIDAVIAANALKDAVVRVTLTPKLSRQHPRAPRG